MVRTQLSLVLAAAICLGAASSGCGNSEPSGAEPVETVFFGRLMETFEVCFVVSEDFTTLTPSTVCDRAQTTPFSFNIEVPGGADQDGASCAFDLPFEDPIPIDSEGAFQAGFTSPDGSIVALLAGNIVGSAANGLARVETAGASCEVLWAADVGPVCRDQDASQCGELLTCCSSIYLIPPIQARCFDVVNGCDGLACQELLAGYTQCAAPEEDEDDEELSSASQ